MAIEFRFWDIVFVAAIAMLDMLSSEFSRTNATHYLLILIWVRLVMIYEKQRKD